MKIDTAKRLFNHVALALIFAQAGVTTAAAAGVQSIESIRLQAESFIANHAYRSPYPPRFELGNLDSRLRLKACGSELAVDFARRDRVFGNTALTIACPSSPRWKIHLPVRIDLFDDVVVTRRSVLKGQIIDDSVVQFQKHDVTRLNNGYFSKHDALENLQAKRNLQSGTVLTPANLSPRMLVRSGQQVTLLLSFNGLQVKSTGKALQSASLGQRVRVRNSQSMKIVEGVVSGEGLVQVNI